MTDQFLEEILMESTYIKKEGTATSYYWSSGHKLLPNRLSISREGAEMAKVEKKGRCALNKTEGQLLGSFRQTEDSPIKRNHPYCVRTQLWKCESYPLIYAYGTIAISDERGKITRDSDIGLLVVLYTPDQGETFRLFYGMLILPYLDQVLDFVERKVR